MPLPVVANLYLCKLHWTVTSAPRPMINDLFIHDDAGGHTGTDVYNALNTNWTRGMITSVNSAAVVDKVITTKLDGTAASIDHSTGSPVKWTGNGGTDYILQGAQVVTLRTGFRGRSRRGRIYLPAIAEDNQLDGVILAANVTTAQTAWDTFLTAMKAAGYPLHVCSRLHSDSIEVVSVTVRGYLNTQRRRARRS
jgi:hypothetical protein